MWNTVISLSKYNVNMLLKIVRFSDVIGDLHEVCEVCSSRVNSALYVTGPYAKHRYSEIVSDSRTHSIDCGATDSSDILRM